MNINECRQIILDTFPGWTIKSFSVGFYGTDRATWTAHLTYGSESCDCCGAPKPQQDAWACYGDSTFEGMIEELRHSIGGSNGTDAAAQG